MHDKRFEVILEVLANTREILHHVDPELAQFLSVTHSRELKQLRRVERSSAEDDLPSPDYGSAAPPRGDFDANGARALEDHPANERTGHHFQVLPAEDGLDVRAGRIVAFTVLDVGVEGREPFLAISVDVVDHLVAGLPGCLEEGTEERVLGLVPMHGDGTRTSSEKTGRIVIRELLESLEVRQTVGVVPCFPGASAQRSYTRGLARWKNIPLIELDPPTSLPR